MDALMERALGELDALRKNPSFDKYRRNRERYYLNVAFPPTNLQRPITVDDRRLISEFNNSKRTALYLHIPFCSYLCTFCHYYKEINSPAQVVSEYVAALMKELRLHAARLADHSIASIYFGGGTPGYLEPTQIAELFRFIRENFKLEKDIEVTFEIDPTHATPERLEALVVGGANRLSIGVQSFDDSILKSTNRRYTVAEALAAIARAKDLPFRSVNVDLMFGLIDQTLDHWKKDLSVVEELVPSAVTVYYQRFREGTAVHKGLPRQIHRYSSEQELTLMSLMMDLLMEQLGYTAPVVDYFVREQANGHKFDFQVWGRPQVFNLVGVGASAYSYNGEYQYSNFKTLEEYVAYMCDNDDLPLSRCYRLSRDEQMRRNLFLGLKVGIPYDYWGAAFRSELRDDFGAELQALERDGVIEEKDQGVHLTKLGRLFADEVGQHFARLDGPLKQSA